MMKASRWTLFIGFALLIFGSKLALIQFAGSDLPFMDQWDAESEMVLRPWLEGRLTPADLLAPHNEHRIVTTKLFALGLFIANRQWDGLLETTANAGVHTLVAVALLLFSRRWLSGAAAPVFGLLLVLLFALPFSWENTLFGFQVQFYFLLLFSLGHLWFALESDRWTSRWLLGQLAGLLALASMGSGFLSAAAVAAALVYRGWRDRRWSAQQIATFALSLIFVTTGWLSRTHVTGHDVLQSHTVGQFLQTWISLLAWPGPLLLPWVAVPAVIFVVSRLRQPHLKSSDSVLLALVAWLWLQTAALAYARGGGLPLGSRYLDLLAMHVALAALLLLRLCSRRLGAAVAGAWLVATVAALVGDTRHQWGGVMANVSLNPRREHTVREYLRTGDPVALEQIDLGELPYPSREALVQRLSSPAIRSVLPPSVRRPVCLVPASPPVVIGGSNVAPNGLHSLTTPAAPAFDWQSARQPSTTLPVLRFHLTGDIGADPALRLLVLSDAGQVAVTSDTAPGHRWKVANIVRPAGAWKVVAADHASTASFGFTNPVELGYGGWIARKLLKHHTPIAASGLVLLALGSALHLFARRRSSGSIPTSMGPAPIA